MNAVHSEVTYGQRNGVRELRLPGLDMSRPWDAAVQPPLN